MATALLAGKIETLKMVRVLFVHCLVGWLVDWLVGKLVGRFMVGW